VSVCIANWNCQDMLRDCLRSLAPRRQGVSLEVIVVDNASTDGAAAMVAREYPEVVLVQNEANAGFARASNQAARLARGRYLFFLNNDTVVPPGALRRLYRFARAHPRAGLVGPLLRDGQGRVQASVRRWPSVAALANRLMLLRWTGLFRSAYRRYRGRDGDTWTTRQVDVLLGAALLMPRAVYRQVGGWDEGFAFGGEDIDLCARVGARFEVVYHPAVEVTHFGRASSRRHAGWSGGQTLIGVTRSLRRTGTTWWALAGYKLAYLLDLPLRGLFLSGRIVWSRLRGQARQAERAWLDLCGLGWFVRHGLGAFWRA
jgi:GT2 family glycosyltransferase